MSIGRWTVQQKLAIDTRRRDVLVTASAGTGKTAVLSERCAGILTDIDDPVDISQVLVLTFTEAAAEEMKLRISSKIRSVAHETASRHLKSQALRLDAAQISTIHSFCKRLIEDNFYKIDTDPSFRMIDSDESMLLKKEVLDDVLHSAWIDERTSARMKELAARRNLATFWDEIINASNFLDGIISRQKWYDRAVELNDMNATDSKNFIEFQKHYFLPILNDCLDMFRHSFILDTQLFKGGFLTSQLQEEYGPVINNLISLVQNGRIDAFIDSMITLELPPLKKKTSEISKDISDAIKMPAKKAIEKLMKLKEVGFINPRYNNVIQPHLSGQSKTLVEILKRFDIQYGRVKSYLNCLDFSDLEHKALELLTDNPEIADNARKRFRHVFVDEYQDINSVQKKIIDLVSSPGNLFVVGDIKQSIYAFRQSKPQIFQMHLDMATDDLAIAGKPLRIDLKDNFRSRTQILDFVNMIFGRIMRPSTAFIDYDNRAVLKGGMEYKPLDEISRFNNPAIELVIMDDQVSEDNSNQETSSSSNSERQAAWIADRIKRMVGSNRDSEFKIYDKNQESYREVCYGDIAILMRSVSNRANEYTKMLRLAGIPVSSQSSEGYFAQTEISDMICLLKVLDNPQRDIEFAAILKSAIFKISDSQLAQIRIHDNKNNDNKLNFYQSVVHYTQSGPDKILVKKLLNILDILSEWRDSAARNKLADLIWQIYQTTGYLAHVRALPGGSQRKANLYKLHDRAVQFEKMASNNQAASLRRFVEFLEQLLNQDQDWSPGNDEFSSGNAVRIMSVHRSKGLEFPVVFLAELGGKFNDQDSKGPCLYDEDLTIGMQIIDSAENTKMNSHLHEMIKQKYKLTNLAEEMRILYVALTRPRERLIICGSESRTRCRNILLQTVAGESIQDYQVKNAKGHFDWILQALANQKILLDEFEIDSSQAQSDNLFTAAIIERNDLDRLADELIKKGRISKKKLLSGPIPSEIKQRYRQMLESVTRQYPYKNAVNMQAKHSVSQLSHNDDEFATGDLSAAFLRMPLIADNQYKGPSRKDIGSAAHLIMEKIDLAKPVTSEQVRQTIEMLRENDLLNNSVIKHIDIDSITGFFKSRPGSQATDPANTVWREWPFTIGIDASIIQPEIKDETIIVQGIIDMLIKTREGLVIIDFKTDQVKDIKQAVERAGIYTEQIRYYCRAAGNILKTEISSAYLYFLNISQALEVDV